MSNNMPQGMKTVMGWILGVAIIAFILLIMVIIFGSLSGNVGFGTDNVDFINETILLSDVSAIPTTAQGRVNGVLTNIVVTNATGNGTGGAEVIVAANFTVTGVGFTSATTTYNNTNVNVSATVTFDEQGKIDTDNLIFNYTTSAVNTSTQFPTVGTIIGVAILLTILIGLLIFAITKMMGVSGVANSKGISSRSTFKGSSREFS